MLILWYNYLDIMKIERALGGIIMGEGLNQKEIEILGFLTTEIKNGNAPSVREICLALGYKSTSTAAKYIDSLVEKGYLIKATGKNRSLRLALQRDGLGKSVPVVGDIAAGMPILAVENIEGYVTVNSKYSEDELFALHVKGESMIESGINDGDIIVARKAETAENGDIIVALIDNEATVKELMVKDDGIYLIPHNSSMSPIFVPKSEVNSCFKILGKIVSLIRNYE